MASVQCCYLCMCILHNFLQPLCPVRCSQMLLKNTKPNTIKAYIFQDIKILLLFFKLISIANKFYCCLFKLISIAPKYCCCFLSWFQLQTNSIVVFLSWFQFHSNSVVLSWFQLHSNSSVVFLSWFQLHSNSGVVLKSISIALKFIALEIVYRYIYMTWHIYSLTL